MFQSLLKFSKKYIVSWILSNIKDFHRVLLVFIDLINITYIICYEILGSLNQYIPVQII